MSKDFKMSGGLEMKYFVLNPLKPGNYGEASRKAIKQYAQSIRKENHSLARQLEGWIARIELGFSKSFNDDGNRDTR